MFKIFKWFNWYFYETRICNHSEYKWMMRESGMGKAKFCKKCGKYLELI